MRTSIKLVFLLLLAYSAWTSVIDLAVANPILESTSDQERIRSTPPSKILLIQKMLDLIST